MKTLLEKQKMSTCLLLSDTHGFHSKLLLPEEKIDLILHAGDLTMAGKEDEVFSFLYWAEAVVQKYSAPLIFIPGNHDFYFEKKRPNLPENVHCLINEKLELNIQNKIHSIYGFPQQPIFGGWAFNLDDSPRKQLLMQAEKDYQRKDYNIFLTHGPPNMILDRTYDGRNVGCGYLASHASKYYYDLIVFGHIHEGRGMLQKKSKHTNVFTTYVNASICNYPHYSKLRDPIVLNLEELKE